MIGFSKVELGGGRIFKVHSSNRDTFKKWISVCSTIGAPMAPEWTLVAADERNYFLLLHIFELENEREKQKLNLEHHNSRMADLAD